MSNSLAAGSGRRISEAGGQEGSTRSGLTRALADEAAQAVREHELDRCVCSLRPAHLAAGRGATARPGTVTTPPTEPRRPDAPPPRPAPATAPLARRRELLIGKRISAGSFALVYAGRYRGEARFPATAPARAKAPTLRRPRAAPCRRCPCAAACVPLARRKAAVGASRSSGRACYRHQ